MEKIHVKKGLEPFWDDYLVDSRHTTAELSVNRPERVEPVMKLTNLEHDLGCIVKTNDGYRMYVRFSIGKYDEARKVWEDYGFGVGVLESKDGIEWIRPNYGLYEFNGSKDNNVIAFSPAGLSAPGCMDAVYKDTNPDCPPDEIYKSIGIWMADDLEGFDDPYADGRSDVGDFRERYSMLCHGRHALVSFVSADGIHFRKKGVITKLTGFYDSDNHVFWNPETKKYYAYFRSHHRKAEELTPKFREDEVREVCVVESDDFVTWKNHRPLNYLGQEDCPVYNNGIIPYPYDEKLFIGFPTRYTERRSWEQFSNFDRLCGREDRYAQCLQQMRQGTALTDMLFMSSRDGENFYRFDEGVVTSGPERLGERWMNWMYGDGYPAKGLIETQNRVPDAQPELSLYLIEGCGGTAVGARLKLERQMVRYVYRMDGFASYKAPYQEKVLRTKLFTFEGNMLKLNFRTSARGYIRLRILDFRGNPIQGYSTYEVFGDNTERIIDFEKPLGELQGKEVSFEFTMSDAEIYAMRFCD